MDIYTHTHTYDVLYAKEVFFKNNNKNKNKKIRFKNEVLRSYIGTYK